MLEIYSNKRDPIKYKSWIFPGGETGFALDTQDIELLEHYLHCHIVARLQSNNDLMELVCCVDSIKRLGAGNLIKLSIPYFPSARQDRVSNPGESLTIKLYADIINNLACDRVEIVDPHSDITPTLLESCNLYPIEYVIERAIEDCKPDFIVSPDAGATKRIEKYLLKIGCELPVIQCLKTRDTKTGKLSGFKVCATLQDIENRKGLIIDDICDGGGTFVGLSKELNKFSLTEHYLYITHGIFSKGYEELLKWFDKIYTTDSFIPKEAPPKDVVVYNLYEISN